MAEAFQKPMWRTFDGREFDSEAEAELYEKQNFMGLLVGLSPAQVTCALMRDPNDKASVAVANAIERAAYLIAQKRKDAGELWRRPKGATEEPAAAPPTTEPAERETLPVERAA